ncbi:MAG: hypothetical protein HN742_19845 [Lentisphaerae bacterium]|jgi:hypothetical protein|nr:hypothetical protein [Lentisphaerota bacterium]MBT4820595.1 hypothetical protein [Lentisphaerota bacterium]MBT5610585.1 hypothetical protein [Lentisphaerota bacterium]MBT7060179.1 hypothetical protein [Lentisphaerota bacterium]MBT7844144.1 hypothetical protein [Lentisphaerota bacterium]
MRIRASSIAVAVAYLVLGGALAVTVPRFGRMFSEFYSSDAPLPGLTVIVLRLGVLGWLVFGIVSAALIVGKDLFPETRKAPNWLFVIFLAFLGAGVALALFMPLVALIDELG